LPDEVYPTALMRGYAFSDCKETKKLKERTGIPKPMEFIQQYRRISL
jgi:hypothetical protein